MIDLRGRYVKTENINETEILLQMATAQGFMWVPGYKPLSCEAEWKDKQYFHFWENKEIKWSYIAFEEYENFSDLISGLEESEETERTITQADFCKAAAEFFRDVKSDYPREIGLAFSILEQKLFPSENEKDHGTVNIASLVASGTERAGGDNEFFSGRDFADAVLACIRDAVDSGNPEKTSDIASVFVMLERELFGV